MQELVKEFLRQKSFAIVGSFRNEGKYAYKILKTLKFKGYEVYPVNPRLREVEGLGSLWPLCYVGRDKREE